MRLLLKVTFPHEPFNSMQRDGTAGPTLTEIFESIKPETVYMTLNNGMRCALCVVNVNSASDYPKIAEPFFLKFEADIEYEITMSLEELGAAGLEELGRRWG